MGARIRTEVPFAIVPEWLIYSGVSDKAVRLYGALARHANDRTFRAHPSRKRLAELLRCSKASIDRATRELVQIGALSVETQQDARKGHQANAYTIHHKPFEQMTLAPPVMIGGPTSDDTPSRVGDDQNESSSLERENNARARGFEDFWKLYPARHGRKIGKAKAVERWSKLAEADQELATRGARAMAAACTRGETFPPDAWRWLRDRLFEDWAQQPVVSDTEHAEIARCAHGYPVIEDDDGHSSPCLKCDAVTLERAAAEHRRAELAG